MTDLRTAAQQALKVLQHGVSFNLGWVPDCEDAITALRAALAEPVLTVDSLRVEFERRYRGNLGITRVEGGVYLSPAIETEWQQFVRKYTTQPQRKPLSEEEIDALAMDEDGLPNSHLEFARAVERAHGIGTERPATLTKPCGSLGEDI